MKRTLKLKMVSWVILGVGFYYATSVTWGGNAERRMMFGIFVAIVARIVQAEVHHYENKLDQP